MHMLVKRIAQILAKNIGVKCGFFRDALRFFQFHQNLFYEIALKLNSHTTVAGHI
jgi:hypothetical protein